jgi:hypothetical protein
MRLEGEADHQPGVGAAANDALQIVTRNVQILPRQIWTAHEVTFAYGANRGSGRDLSITLSPTGGRHREGGDALARNLRLSNWQRTNRCCRFLPMDCWRFSCPRPRPDRSPRPHRRLRHEVTVTCQAVSFRFPVGRRRTASTSKCDNPTDTAIN